MDNVVELDSYRPHSAGEAKCLACQHTWQAIALLGTTDLECPECHLKRGVYSHNFGAQIGQAFISCRCGCKAFEISPEHAQCMRCGLCIEIIIPILEE